MPRRRYDNETVLGHLFTLAVIASGGVAIAKALDLIALSWPDVMAIAIWFTGLSILTAMSLSTRVRPVIEP